MNSSQNIDTHDRCAVVMAIIAAHSLTKYGFPVVVVATITFVNKKKWVKYNLFQQFVVAFGDVQLYAPWF